MLVLVAIVITLPLPLMLHTANNASIRFQATEANLANVTELTLAVVARNDSIFSK